MATSPLASSFVELARALHIATRQAGPLLGVEFDAESIADALWLAQWLAPTAKVTVKEESPKEPGQSAAPPVDISDSKKLDETKPDPTRKPDLGDPNRKPDGEGGQKDKANQLFSESSTGQRRASAIHVPAASALPGSLELARALRPFNRRRRAVNRWELDEEATAESIAQFRFIRPVLRAVSERWFDVALVVDGALSMDPWRKTLNEFELLLNRHGAFRQVRRWRLIGEPEIALESGGAQSTVKALLDSRERTLILLATNGVAEYWNSPSMAAAMALWAKRAPVAIIQVFGSSQWPHTVIGPASRTVRAPLPGSPTGKFEIERKRWERRQREGAFTAVPILSLSPESIAQWANASMGIGLGGTPAVVFGYRTYEPAVAGGERAAAPDPLSLVQSFKTYASPQAFRLACYLAATTLTPPVMRIVQQEIALAPRVEHLAEVVASGLIERITPARPNLDPDEIVYDFRDGVRDVLLGALPTSTALEVRKIVEEALKQFIETQLGRSIESFRAFILDDRGSYEVPESARALVVIERSLLERFGFGAVALELKGPGLSLQGHRGAINAIAFNLDGSLLISASADRTIKIWDAGSGAALHTLIGHEESVTCLAFSADGQTLISSSRDGTVCAWNLWGDGQLLFQFDGGTGSVLSIARLSPVTGLSVAIAAVRSGLGIWNLASGLEVLSMNEGSIVYCVAASTDGTQLLTCQEGKVLLRSSVDMRVVRSLEHEQGSSRSAAFAPDGNVIASGSGEEIVVWETESGRQIRRFSTFDQQPEFAFSPDGKLLAASVGGQRVLVWNYRTGEEVYRLDHVSVSCLCFGRDSYALAIGSSDSSISLWDLRAHTSEPVRLTGRAKNPRTLYVIASEHPDDFAVKETITEGLISAGHRVVTDPAISPDAVITFDASAPVHFQVKAILAKSAAELISIFVPSGPSGEFEFDDRSRWQSSFDRLLKKLDELVAPGRLLGVPELPEPYWRRKELRNIPRFWMATIIAPEGSGRHTFAAAVAREPSIRRRYPGGIYWEPTTYPAAKEPVLLIIPRFRWVDFLRQQDGILGIGDEWFSESSLTVSVFRLPDLDRSEQLDFLGAYRPPPAVLTPALGRLALLARWRLITEQFGAERIAQWLENKSVPQEYGAEAMLVAVHCTLDLLSTEDRTVLEFLANDPKASLDDRARAADLPPGAVQHAIDTAASLNMLIASRAGGLRPEFRQVLSDVSDGAEPSDRLLFFLSYAHRDKVFARRFANLVVQQASQILGKPQVFADDKTAPSIAAWDPSIISNLLRSDAVLFILSAAALSSGPVMQILHRSRSENIPTITLQIEHCEIPPEIAVTQLLDLSVTNLHAVDPFDERLDALVQSAVKLIVNASRSRNAQFHGESAADKSSVTEPFFDPERLAHLAQSEGYSRVLQTLYAQLKTSPEATKLYWKLLAAELRGEEDWSAWFAKIIEQRPTLESAAEAGKD